MIRWMIVLFILIHMTVCKKPVVTPPEDTHPLMRYIELADTSIVFGKGASFDLDGNGSKDVYFVTQLVGDPINQQDKRQWLAGGSFTTYFPVNPTESIPVMRSMDDIPISSFSGYNWYNAPEILLAQKILSMNIPPYWTGEWKDANHRFIPLQIKNGNDPYNGWVEVSFSTANEKMILHKAAISKEPNKAIKAGK